MMSPRDVMIVCSIILAGKLLCADDLPWLSVLLPASMPINPKVWNVYFPVFMPVTLPQVFQCAFIP